MNAETIREVVQELHREHAMLIGDGIYEDLSRTLTLLPRDGVWAVAKPKPVIMARSNDTLFQISLSPDKDRVATITSRPLGGEKIAVGLEWGEPSADEAGVAWRETKWTFRFVGQGDDDTDEWQHITGRVFTTHDGERLDRREHFARELAAQAGWSPLGIDG